MRNFKLWSILILRLFIKYDLIMSNTRGWFDCADYLYAPKASTSYLINQNTLSITIYICVSICYTKWNTLHVFFFQNFSPFTLLNYIIFFLLSLFPRNFLLFIGPFFSFTHLYFAYSFFFLNHSIIFLFSLSSISPFLIIY